MKAATWTGTLQCSGDSKSTSFSNIANANASIRFCGFTNYTHNATSASGFAAIELVGDGLSLAGDDSAQNQVWTFTNALKGDGALTLADNTGSVLLSGDVSGFTGNVTASGTSSAITFGSSTTGNGQRIVVGGGESVTNAAGATWSTANVIVRGELVANGTMSATKLWGDSGTGVYRANNSAAAIDVASSWNGTYVIGWAGANGTAIKFNSYGNSGSKIVVPEGSTLQGYIDVTANNTLTNNAEVVVDGVLNLSNGYDYSTVVWKKLSGSGTVKYAFAPTHWIKEKIVELDRFTGSIEVSKTTQLKIESVNLSADAVANVRVVPIAVTSGGTVDGDMIVKVNGTANGQTFEYKADGAAGEGLYLVSSAPTDPWNTPDSDAGVADALSTDGLVTESAAVTNVAGFTALVDYITNHVTGVAAPADMTPSQKANAVLCYALNATTIPDTVIESATIDAITQPDANGAMELTVTIPGVAVGETVDASLLAKVVSAKGGTALNAMSAANVIVSGYGSGDGKVVITVTPVKADPSDPAPTTFFMSAVITK